VSALPEALPRELPVEVVGERAPGWWGMLMLVGTEATLFASLLSGYFYLRAGQATWPPSGIERPELTLPLAMTAVLLASSGPMWWAERSIRRGDQLGLRLGLLLSLLLGLTFLLLQGYEYSQKSFTLQSGAYGSLFFTITGFHGLHVLAGLLMNALVQLRAWLGHFTARRRLAVQNVALYWHFVDVVWLFILLSLYVSPRVL
jgi:heme/copper-type cytochrome/quinol oxidase subunit 3